MPEEQLKILIIEDDETVAESIKNAIKEKIPSECIVENSFEKGEAIVGPLFDLVILDQLKGAPVDQNLAGRPVWRRIHEDPFVPVVVYSATELALDEQSPPDNPVLIHIRKGQNSEEVLRITSYREGKCSLG